MERWDKIDFLFRVGKHFRRKYASCRSQICEHSKSTYTTYGIYFTLGCFGMRTLVININFDRKHLRNIYVIYAVCIRLWNTRGFFFSFETIFLLKQFRWRNTMGMCLFFHSLLFFFLFASFVCTEDTKGKKIGNRTHPFWNTVPALPFNKYNQKVKACVHVCCYECVQLFIIIYFVFIERYRVKSNKVSLYAINN